jgi:predicted enzyme related to lactoylglutathione lyase
MEVEGADFAVVFTQDYERAKDFYENTLGLEHTVDYGKIPAGEFETGNLTLSVIDAASVGREFSASGAPIALRVADVAAARAELEGAGVEFLGETMDSGVCFQALFKDPDGIVLTLHHRYAPRD